MIKSFYRFSVVIIAFLLVTTSSYSLVPRKVLMEDFTGAWCGWCVLGNQAAEDMLLQYGTSFIPVAIHNGDASSDVLNTPLEPILRSPLGVTGFPSGVLNRMSVMVNGTLSKNGHPIYWPQMVADHINDMSPCDVDVTYTLDKNAKTLTATVKATFSGDVTGQLAFNLYVMEDNMNGSDQHNYLTGNPTYKDNPYYSEPSTITNYKHQNVLLDMLGGAYGIKGTFPAAGVKNGETYEYTFNFNLANLGVPYQNLDKMWFVGLVEKTGSSYEILNAKAINKQLPLPKVKLTTTNSENYNIVERGKSFTQTLQLQNTSQYDVTVDLTLNTSKYNMPGDWKVTIDNPQITIPANSTKTANVSFDIGTTAFFSEINIDATVESTSLYDGKTITCYIGLLSDGIDYVCYHFNDGRLAPISTSIASITALANKIAFIPMKDGSLLAYKNYNFKLGIVPETYASYGSLLNNTNALSYFNSMVTSGKPLLITSILDLFFVAGNSSSFTPDAATKTFFNTTLGIAGPKQTNPLMAGNPNQGTLTYIGITGTTDDISKGYTTTLNQYNQSTFPYYTFYLDQPMVTNTSIATPVMTYNVTTTPNTTAAVKVQTATNRNIYSGFSFDLIADAAKRTTLLGNMVTWLLGTNSVDLDQTNAAKLSVYPNPVSTASTVSFEAPAITSAEVFVMDINGNKVLNLNTQTLTEGLNILNLNASSLASGSYYVITNINGVYSYLPFVIQK